MMLPRGILIGLGAMAAIYFATGGGSPGTATVDVPTDGTNGIDGVDTTVLDTLRVTVLGVPDYLNQWADAITSHELWLPPGVDSRYPSGTLAYRNNNPGNLVVDGDDSPPRDAHKYGRFTSYAAGRDALLADLTAKVRKYGAWNLGQVMTRYAPLPDGTYLNAGNDPVAYTRAIAAALNVPATTLVRDIAGLWSSKNYAWNPKTFQGTDVQLASTSYDAMTSSDEVA